MNSQDINEILPSLLYTAPVILCVFISNLFFCIFRWYHASVPLYQNLLINVLFSHLSVLWQASNIINAIHLLTNEVFLLDNFIFSCVLYHVRQFQQTMSVFCFLLVSVSYFIAHFKADLYLKIQHPSIASFTSFALFLSSLTFSTFLAIQK